MDVAPPVDSESSPAVVKLVSGHDVRLSERYVILERIGIGLSCEVFRAQDKSDGKYVAVKSVGKRWGSGSHTNVARMRAERELAILRRCGEAELNEDTKGHPHIIRLLACVETDAALHFVTPLCDGGDLLGLLSSRGGILSESEIVKVMNTLCNTVLWLHTVAKVVHRDIKPE
jgi:serine/threonine protein kinase